MEDKEDLTHCVTQLMNLRARINRAYTEPLTEEEMFFVDHARSILFLLAGQLKMRIINRKRKQNKIPK